MATLPFLGGILNYTAFGLPYYLWIIFGMFIIGIIIAALWYFFFWLKLTPYHGVLWATLKKFGISFVFDENMKFDLITDRSSKVIFAETFAQAQEAENDNTRMPTATLGTVHGDFIFDPDKWTYPNSYQHKIIEDIAEQWNNENPLDQVRTLIKFSRYVSEGRFGEAYSDRLNKLKLVYYVQWSRVWMMYKDREESGYFGFVMSLANTIREIEQASYNQYAILVLGLFGLLDLVYFAAWVISRKP